MNPLLDDEAQETRPNGETRVPAQLLIRSTRSSNVHVELNSYLFEVGSNSLPSSLFALSPCFESSQYLQFGFLLKLSLDLLSETFIQFNLSATHESKQHVQRFENEFKNMVLHQIIEGSGVEFYRISDLVLMNDNHADKMIYVEFYMLPRDELSTDDSLTVAAASQKLNQTINSNSFRTWLSEFGICKLFLIQLGAKKGHFP